MKACPRCNGPMWMRWGIGSEALPVCCYCSKEGYGAPDPEVQEVYERSLGRDYIVNAGDTAKKSRQEGWRNRRAGEKLPVAGERQSVNRKVE